MLLFIWNGIKVLANSPGLGVGCWELGSKTNANESSKLSLTRRNAVLPSVTVSQRLLHPEQGLILDLSSQRGQDQSERKAFLFQADEGIIILQL